MIPNLSWGLLDYEADFVVLSKSGYLTEVEIKRSWEDFKADFNKKHKHDADQVYYFYYCVPEKIYDKVISFIQLKSSANINTNPRTEQGVITIDRGLVDFYKNYFDKIKSYE